MHVIVAHVCNTESQIIARLRRDDATSKKRERDVLGCENDSELLRGLKQVKGKKFEAGKTKSFKEMEDGGSRWAARHDDTDSSFLCPFCARGFDLVPAPQRCIITRFCGRRRCMCPHVS